MKRPLVITLALSGDLETILQRTPAPRFGALAACADLDPELFDGESEQANCLAKAICAVCPVQRECARWGLESHNFAIYGGLTPQERFELRGGKDALEDEVVAEVRQEYNFIVSASAAEVAFKHQVDQRTVVRWRNILRPLKVAA